MTFLAHGSQKLLGWFGGHGMAGTVQAFHQGLGIPVPLAYLAIFTELFGGAAVLLGLLTRPAALGLAVTMAVAIFRVHWPNGFFLNAADKPRDGIEFALALLGMSLALVLSGAGAQL